MSLQHCTSPVFSLNVLIFLGWIDFGCCFFLVILLLDGSFCCLLFFVGGFVVAVFVGGVFFSLLFCFVFIFFLLFLLVCVCLFVCLFVYIFSLFGFFLLFFRVGPDKRENGTNSDKPISLVRQVIVHNVLSSNFSDIFCINLVT